MKNNTVISFITKVYDKVKLLVIVLQSTPQWLPNQQVLEKYPDSGCCRPVFQVVPEKKVIAGLVSYDTK